MASPHRLNICGWVSALVTVTWGLDSGPFITASLGWLLRDFPAVVFEPELSLTYS